MQAQVAGVEGVFEEIALIIGRITVEDRCVETADRSPKQRAVRRRRDLRHAGVAERDVCRPDAQVEVVQDGAVPVPDQV